MNSISSSSSTSGEESTAPLGGGRVRGKRVCVNESESRSTNARAGVILPVTRARARAAFDALNTVPKKTARTRRPPPCSLCSGAEASSSEATAPSRAARGRRAANAHSPITSNDGAGLSGAPQGVAASGGTHASQCTGLTATEAASAVDGPVRTDLAGAAPHRPVSPPHTAPPADAVEDEEDDVEPDVPARAERAHISRDGDTLIALHPTPNFYTCTERGCGDRFRCATWTATRRSVERHLLSVHGIKIASVRNICRYCDAVLGLRPTYHTCDAAPAMPQRFSSPVFNHRCTECDKSFPSGKGLANHRAKHVADRLRAERVQPLPIPRTWQGMRRLRGEASPDVNDASGADDEDETETAETEPRVPAIPEAGSVAGPLDSQRRAPQEPRRGRRPNGRPASTSSSSGDDVVPHAAEDVIPAPVRADREPAAPPPPRDTSRRRPRDRRPVDPPPASPSPIEDADSSSEAVTPTPRNIDDARRERRPAGPSQQTQIDDEPQDPLGAFVSPLEDLLDRPADEATWQEFNAILVTLMEATATHAKLRPPRDPGPNHLRRQPDPNDAKTVQRLYRLNRRRAVRLITGDQGPRCRIGPGEVTRHFTDVWSDREHDPAMFTADNHPRRPQLSVGAFAREEVESRLRRCENTSPGPDRISYAMWRRADPEGRALTAVFNVCLKHRRIPQEWKSTRTVLIHKKGQQDDLANWRPIALSNTIYKLYAGCLAARLAAWLAEHQVLHPAQKGFTPHDGVFEHNFVLGQAIHEARRGRRRLCVAWLDAANAFGSIPLGAVRDAVRSSGVGAAFTQVVDDIITDNSTEIMTSEGPTRPIPVGAGVKQGCPLSGLLFDLVVDPIIRRIQGNHTKHRVLAYADDLVLLAEDAEELQEMIDEVEGMARRIAMLMNPDKSKTVHFRSTPMFGVHQTTFWLAGREIPKFDSLADYEPFLGVPVGFSVIPSNATIHHIVTLGLRLLQSKLAPWQRLDALRTFVASSETFHMRIGTFSKSDWNEVDRILHPEIKRTQNLTQEAADEYLYGSTQEGLCGAPLMAESSDLATIDSAYKIIHS